MAGSGDVSVIKTSILILTKNEAQNIGACLEAVYAQKHGGSREVIVLDSGSTDATLQIARRYPVRIEQIPAEAFHHARTRNYAATISSGEFLVYLAADARPVSNNWLQPLLSNFADPSVGAVYGRHVPKSGAGLERHVALAALYGESRIVKYPHDGIMLGYKYYHFSTVNAAIRKKTWELTQFPEELKVFEDVGIAKRILDSGWSIIYEPEAVVHHSHDYPFSVLFKRYFDIGVVYQRLGVWNKNSCRAVRRDGWRALRNKVSRVVGKGRPKGGAFSILEDIGKYVAIELGRNERVLPGIIKKRLSQFRLFD